MRRWIAVAWLLVAGCFLSAEARPQQAAALRVVSTAPSGDIESLAQAAEIRVIFSEPMVALGRVPAQPEVPWATIAPALKGAWRWSGTTVLIFTPDPATALPYATRYTVTIAAGATSAAGQRLAQPVAFTFTTPTVKLADAYAYRKGDRVSGAAVLALRFNQPVRSADIVSHLAVRQQPYVLDGVPDANGDAALAAKIAAARAVAGATTPWPVRPATDWDTERFPAAPNVVVVETTGVPPAGAHLEVVVGARVPSAGGREVPGAPQSSTVTLERIFFGPAYPCDDDCDPSGGYRFVFPAAVTPQAFARALTVRDVTTAARERAITPRATATPARFDQSQWLSIEDAGFAPQPPATSWRVRLDPSLTAADGQTLGYAWTRTIRTARERAFVGFGDGHGVWETGGGAQLPFYARNFQTVQQWIQRLTPAELMPRIRELGGKGFDQTPPGAGTTRRLTVTSDVIQSHGFDLSRALSPSGTGLAWVAVKPGTPIAQSTPSSTRPRSSIVQATNLGITVKDSPQGSLIFVTRLDTAAPVAGAKVTVVNLDNTDVWSGTTNADGLALTPPIAVRTPDESWALAFLVTAEKDGDVAYVCSDWNEGIEPWEFGTSYNLHEATDVLRGSVFTDRGVYKPGEEVHVKAVLRHDTPAGVVMLPPGTALDVVVKDARDKTVDARRITVSRWSSAEWTWTVPAVAGLGTHSITVTRPAPAGTPVPAEDGYDPTRWTRQITGSFLVAAYRKPDFRVDVSLTPDGPALAGAPLKARVSARYLFGGAMTTRPLTWSLTRAAAESLPAAITETFEEARWAFGYRPERRRDAPAFTKVAAATLALDASSAFAATLASEPGADAAYEYTFEGDVEDLSRQHIANRASVVVHPAPWYIGMKRLNDLVPAGAGATTEVVAVGLDGAITPHVKVTVSLVRIQYISARRAEGGGFYDWESTRREIPAGTWTVTTGAAPVPLTIPVPEGGSYVLHATAADAAGHVTRTDASFYAEGAGYTAWERFGHNRIELTPAKTRLAPGDTAKILIKSPWDTATALVTVEREGIRSVRRFALTSTQQTIDVPVTAKDIPNVYVSVLLVKGRTAAPNDAAATAPDGPGGTDPTDPGKPAFRLGYTELTVSDASKQLDVKVTADKPEYRPARQAKVNVLVRDRAGKGATSEVTLWAVDAGVLALTGYDAPNIRDAVWVKKALQVMTEDSRQRIVSRRVITPKGADEGGGGGAEGGPNGARKDLRPLAFWLGSVVTDKSGKTSATVTLPESLTTWRIMAVAADDASRFGAAAAEIRVAKPLTILPAFPRFLTVGDVASFGGTITNLTGKAGTATVTMASLGPALGFTSATQTVTLAAGATEAVRFDARAVAAGTTRIRMRVALGNETDAVELPVPVQLPARLETTAAFGDTTGTATQPLAALTDVRTDVGGLDVSLASTALVGLTESVRYLTDYPFLCTEQRASRALASLLAADLGASFAIGGATPAAYRAQAESLLAALPNAQCADGGFALWPGHCLTESAYLTAWVLDVMKTAQRLGYTLDATVTGKALDFLERDMKTPAPSAVGWQPVWGASQAFAVKVLTEYGRPQDANLTRLAALANRLPVFALSYLADALKTAGDTGPRYQDVIRRIGNALRVEGDTAHVEELDGDALAWLWHSNVRATATVLDGWTRRGDAPAMAAPLVRWLTRARTNGRWGNTQENAQALAAFVSYYRTNEAATPDMTATVAIGAKTLGTAAFAGRTTTQAPPIRLAMAELIAATTGGTTPLSVSRTGDGRLYYTARLQYVPTGTMPALDNGLRIERRFETFVENGTGVAATAFAAGDLVRVVLRVTAPTEARFVAVTDPLAAGFDTVDGWFKTTASDMARDASRDDADTGEWWERWQRGGFDMVEKFDDRVQLFATRLSAGTHEFSYLVRATTSGTFIAAGASAELMYQPETFGRSPVATLVIR